MRKATKEDRKRVVDIIQQAFNESPSVDWVIKSGTKRQKKLRNLAKYAFDVGLKRKGVYLSDDNSAIAIIYKSTDKIGFLLQQYYDLRLLFQVIGFGNVFNVLKRQRYFAKQRPKNEDYLYFWFFGVSDEGKGQGGANELQRDIYRLSEECNLPIILETSIRKNRVVYQRFGFHVYHTWHVKEEGIDMWFMRRDP